MNNSPGCRHCCGLIAGRADKCPYCKNWLRREPVQLGGTSPQAQSQTRDLGNSTK